MDENKTIDDYHEYLNKLDKVRKLLISKRFRHNHKNGRLLFGEIEGKLNPEAFAYAERILKQAYLQAFKEKLVKIDFNKVVMDYGFTTMVASYVTDTNEQAVDRFTLVAAEMIRTEDQPCTGIIIDWTNES